MDTEMAFRSERSYTVTSREEGRYRQIRPSAMLAQLQDCAVGFFFEIGKGKERMIEECGAFWMLTRIRYELQGPVYAWDTLTFRTVQRRPKGAMLYLDHEIFRDGACIGTASAIWVLASVEGHELLRLTAAGDLNATAGSEKTVRLGRIRMPEGMAEEETRTVRCSELDSNDHMNNTRYADYAMDAIHGERLTGEEFVSALAVNYEKELLCGEQVRISVGKEAESNVYAVRGQDPGGIVRFDARIQVSRICSLSDITVDRNGKIGV